MPPTALWLPGACLIKKALWPEGLPGDDRAAEGEGVGVFEVVAETQAAGEGGDLHALAFDLAVDI